MSASAEHPEWMALYDLASAQDLETKAYTRLRTDAVKSGREKAVMREIAVDRRVYELVLGREGERYGSSRTPSEGKGNVILAMTLKLEPGKEREVEAWYRDEHIGMLAKVPGWRRSRVFARSLPVATATTGDGDGNGSGEREPGKEFLALHEYGPDCGLGGEELKAAFSTPKAHNIMTDAVVMQRRTWELYYTFGVAPRDLGSLSGEGVAAFESPDGMTRTLPAATTTDGPAIYGAAIESYVTASDGVVLPFRLEGSLEPDAPLIVLSNSVLVEWGIWDEFVATFFSVAENSKYRILRYQARGRSAKCGDTPVTVDVLATDIVALLDAIRVPKAACLVGVSLGGATVLNAALKHSARVAAFVSCDTNAKSPDGNRKAWGERIVVAEREGAKDQKGKNIVGEDLAEMTVRRWFVSESYNGGMMEKRVQRVKSMVRANSLDGFKRVVQALYEYDLRDDMRRSSIKAAFLVGSGDGVLPGAMEEMAQGFGDGASYVVIEGAGHLPMVERPEEVVGFVAKFLAS